MLSFTNLALRRGPNLLFEDASFVIHRDKKVGLIGSNGAGKTSLFKMITGELDVEEGYLDYPHDLRISCVSLYQILFYHKVLYVPKIFCYIHLLLILLGLSKKL